MGVDLKSLNQFRVINSKVIKHVFIILRFCPVMSGQSCIQTIRNISSYMNENTFALLPRHKVLCNISLSTSTITAIKYNIYSSVHTLVLAFYDDLYPETKNKFYKNKLRRITQKSTEQLRSKRSHCCKWEESDDVQGRIVELQFGIGQRQ